MKPMSHSAYVVITGPNHWQGHISGKGRAWQWLYLGQDRHPRNQLAQQMGEDRLLPLQGRLHATAAELRQPYLDFVAEMGSKQRNPRIWWSTRFSWKIWTASDFFLLTCYLKVAEQITQEALEQDSALLIVVEDPWLLRQMHLNFKHLAPHLLVDKARGLTRFRLRSLLMGLLRRIKWAAKTPWDFLRQRSTWPEGKPRGPQGEAAAVFSFPQPESFGPENSWIDPYLPGIDAELERQKLKVMRFTPPETSGFERELTARAEYIQPLILWSTWVGYFRSLFAFWRPQWRASSLKIQERAVHQLCRREWWLELSHAGLCVYSMFYACFSRMLSSGPYRLIVTFYENQPWEKMAALAAKETQGVRLLAIQNAIFSRYHLAFFLGKGEAERMPLPDAICTSGPQARDLLIEGGHRPERLGLCGSIRYPHLAHGAGKEPAALPPAPASEILVTLPIDRTFAQDLLAALGRAFPDGGQAEGIRFHIRPHPICPFKQEEIGFPAQTLSSGFGNFQDALKRCGLVLFAGSTAGFEAMALGRRAIRYRAELMLDVDESYGDSCPVATEQTLRSTVLKQAGEALTTEDPHLQPVLEKLFTPPSSEGLRQTFGALCETTN